MIEYDNAEATIAEATRILREAQEKLQMLSRRIRASCQRLEKRGREDDLSGADSASGGGLARLRQADRKIRLLIRDTEDSLKYLEGESTEGDTARKEGLDLALTSAELSPVRAIRSQEEERYRLAQAIQKDLAQLLANALFELQSYDRILESDPQAAREGLSHLKEELRDGLDEVRWLISNLQPPPLLADLGLAAGLRRYVEGYQKRSGIKVDLNMDELTERLPATMEVAIFRIVQEALQNVHKYAQATRVSIDFQRDSDLLVFTVEDNGRGFDVEPPIGQRDRNLGLIGMYDRATLLQGRLRVFSKRDHGTKVVLSVPYPFVGD
ncbi:MAG TPA: sensor histidine kinase [Anaerolineae bacterium]|nr:sensor histidine kinase [Anaerolineae bacterium]